MVSIGPYNTQFTLSRDYLAECYDQSLPYGKSAKSSFLFPALILAFGVGILVFTEQPKYLGFILITLAVLELIHIRFRRAWWLARQMWGRSANCKVSVSLDEEGLRTQNPYTQSALSWTDIERVIETDLGLIFFAKRGGQQYLSKSLFPVELISEIIALNEG